MVPRAVSGESRGCDGGGGVSIISEGWEPMREPTLEMRS